MSTPKGKRDRINWTAPEEATSSHTDSRGSLVFDSELSKIRRPAYEERMGFSNPQPPKRRKPLAPWEQAFLQVDENGKPWYPETKRI